MNITLHQKEFAPFLKHSEIDQAISVQADAINKDLSGKDVVFLGVLDGSFMVLADLEKKVEFTHFVDFIKLKSYQGVSSTGQVRQLLSFLNH